jgi:hypothetical protein
MSPAERRKYVRQYASEKRLAEYRAKAMARTTCPRKINRWSKCGTRLQSRVENGETVPYCTGCELRKQGICLTCKSAPVKGVVGRAAFCALCLKLRSAERAYQWRARHKEKVAKWSRERARRRANDPAYIARKAALQRLRARRRGRRDWHKTEKGKAYLAAFRARPENVAAAKERNARIARGLPVAHQCVKCGTDITGRAKKCELCRAQDLSESRRIAFGEAAA